MRTLRAVGGRLAVDLPAALRAPESLIIVAFWVAMVVFQDLIDAGNIAGTNVPEAALQIAGMPAMAATTSTLMLLPQQVSNERQDGTLRRLRAWPGGVRAFVLARIVSTAAVALVAIAVVLGVSLVTGAIDPPDAAGDWTTLAWSIPLGVLALSMIGFLLGVVLNQTREGGGALFYSLVALVMVYSAGIFQPLRDANGLLSTVGTLNPLTWMARAARSAFLPESFQAAEPAGSWQLTSCALWLGGWSIVAFVAAVGVLRWRAARDERGTAVDRDRSAGTTA